MDNLLTEGIELFETEKYGDAIRAFSGYLAEHQDNISALSYRAAAYNVIAFADPDSARRTLKLALRDLDKVCALQPNDPDMLLLRGMTLGNLGRHKDALSVYDRVLHLRTDDAQALYNSVLELAIMKRYEAAFSRFQRLQRIENYEDKVTGYNDEIVETLAMDLYEKGRHAIKKGDFKKALTIAELMFSVAPDSPHIRNMRAVAKVGLKCFEAAKEDFRYVVGKKPEDLVALYGYALACYLSNEVEEALASLNKILSIAPDYDVARITKWGILGEIEANRATIGRYREAVRRIPGDGDVRFLVFEYLASSRID